MLTTLLSTQQEGAILQQVSLISLLSVTILFFLVLLIIGIRNSIKLKEENDRLSKPSISSEEDNKVYKDFREGHLYDSF